MIRLNIPYRSQWNKKDAGDYNADCGPTCAAMVLNYHHVSITTNRIYAENFPDKGEKDFTTLKEMGRVFRKYNVPTAYKKYNNKREALIQLRANIDAGKPMIALVRYEPWQKLIKNNFKGGHFVVVTGYDEAHIYMHDPLFGLWIKPSNKGSHFGIPIDLFCEGWGGLISPNPDWACFVVPANTAVSKPTPQPAPAAPVVPPKPAPPVKSGPTMQDVNRRIRALAAYRWAAEPNFNDETAVKLWRDHLGDWGLNYVWYVVQSGDLLSALAGRFFGEQHRWYAIQEYNDMSSDNIWVGQPLLIPKMGQSGAQTTTALPSDTVSKSLDFDNLVDPDLPAQDYNSLWDDSINLGFDTQEGN